MLFDYCHDESWTLTSCRIPFGQQFCHGHVWTQVCAEDAHCRPGTRCVTEESVGVVDTASWGYGWCSVRCADSDDCFRPDMYCGGDGVCRVKPVPERD